jgi:hypothetical protein
MTQIAAAARATTSMVAMTDQGASPRTSFTASHAVARMASLGNLGTTQWRWAATDSGSVSTGQFPGSGLARRLRSERRKRSSTHVGPRSSTRCRDAQPTEAQTSNCRARVGAPGGSALDRRGGLPLTDPNQTPNAAQRGRSVRRRTLDLA